MRRWILVLVIGLAACSSPRKVEQRVRYERRDTVRALLGEDLTVRLDDVRILRLDSPKRSVEAKVITLERRRRAEIEAASCDSVQAEVKEEVATCTIASGTGVPIWALVITAIVGFVIGLRWRR